MRKALVVGRKIVGVRQWRDTASGGIPVRDLGALELDNGTVILFSVSESPDASHYIVEATAYPKKKEGAGNG